MSMSSVLPAVMFLARFILQAARQAGYTWEISTREISSIGLKL